MPTSGRMRKFRRLTEREAERRILRLARERIWARLRDRVAGGVGRVWRGVDGWLNRWRMVGECPSCGAPIYGRRREPEARRTCAGSCRFNPYYVEERAEIER
jgi:hypothetical protein